MAFVAQLSLLFASDSGADPDPMVWNPDLALFTLLLFIVFVAVLSFFAWNPIMKALDAREQSMTEKIESAEANAAKMESLKNEYEAKLSLAAEDAARMISEAKKDAEEARAKIVADAAEEANRQRERAVADINSAKDAAIRDLAQKTVDQAVALAGNLVRKEINTDVHQQLIRESLDKFSNVN